MYDIKSMLNVKVRCLLILASYLLSILIKQQKSFFKIVLWVYLFPNLQLLRKIAIFYLRFSGFIHLVNL